MKTITFENLRNLDGEPIEIEVADDFDLKSVKIIAEQAAETLKNFLRNM